MIATKVDLVKAIIIDVRSDQEYNLGHIEESINIPLDELEERVDELSKMNGEIVLCCQSGTRSASAVDYLKGMGCFNVHNGGGWSILNLQVINSK